MSDCFSPPTCRFNERVVRFFEPVIRWIGDHIARGLGLDRLLRVKTFPIGFGLPTGLVVGPMNLHIPLPHSILIEVCDPIELEGNSDDEEAVDRGYDLVTWTMQERLTELATELRS